MELFPKNKIIIGMVGLPGRGKTYIAKKIARYINWLGYKSEVFNICQYRRDLYSDKEFTAEFFDPNNTEASKFSNDCADRALEDLMKYLKDGGDVAVYDGVNATVERRKAVNQVLKNSLSSYSLIWVESVCNDEAIIEDNIRATQSSSPDYKDMDSTTATKDYIERIEHHKKIYQELSKEKDGSETSFIKIYDFGSQALINNVSGYLESKIMSLLMHIHNRPRPIYFTRHGESMFNVEDKVGGNPDLSERGYAYTIKLNQFFQEEMKQRNINKNTKMFCSTLQRTIKTAGAIDVGLKATRLKMLDEIHSGSFDGMTYSEISKLYPNDAQERAADKLRYRYPNGESYVDVIQRIEPVIFAIEKSKEPIIIVAHQAVIRCLYAYFCKSDIEEIPHLSIPLHTVIKLVPESYYAHEYRYALERSKHPTYHKRMF